MARYKVILGDVRQAGWCGQVHPNVSLPWDSFGTVLKCTDASRGKPCCLFDVIDDPGEHHDLALEMPGKAQELADRLHAAERHWFNPDRGDPDPRACRVAAETGFVQPFLP